jgi:hypothetical protein
VFSTAFGFSVIDGAGGVAGPGNFTITASIAIPPPPPAMTPPPPPITAPPAVPPPPTSLPVVPPLSGGSGSADVVPYVSTGTSGARSTTITRTAVQPPAPIQAITPVNTGTIASANTEVVLRHAEISSPSNQSFRALELALDNLRRDINEDVTLNLRIASAPTISSAILTVGFVSWLLRSGALVSSLMATAPLWNRLDPVPILAGGRRDKKRDEEIRERIAAARDRGERTVRKLFKDDAADASVRSSGETA